MTRPRVLLRRRFEIGQPNYMLGGRKRTQWLAVISLVSLIACGDEVQRSARSAAAPSTSLSIPQSPVRALAPTATIYRVGNGVTAPHLISKTNPTIPEKCKMSLYEGAFIFEASISETGEVGGIRTIRKPNLTPSCPELEEICRRAVASWRYKPAIRDGKPVPVYLTISVMFHP